MCVCVALDLRCLLSLTACSCSLHAVCASNYVQSAFLCCVSPPARSLTLAPPLLLPAEMTFDSYLYKTVVPGNPLDDAKLLGETLGTLLRANALKMAASS